MSDRKALAIEIRDFLEKHAGIAANYDPEYDDFEDRFSGPDPAMLEMAAIALEKDIEIDFYPHSEWGSGCYHPHDDKDARAKHDDLVARVNALRVYPTPTR